MMLTRPDETVIKQTPESLNIAAHLPRMAALVPDQPAVTIVADRDTAGKPIYKSLTFKQLDAYSNKCANGLTQSGITRGMRTLVMVRPDADFFAIIFALFKMGAVPVMIDPGMGVARLLQCVRQVDLHAFIGIPIAQIVRAVNRKTFRNLKSIVTVGRKSFWKGDALDDLTANASDHFDCAETAPDETAAILFTSGSTGPAKGVVYEHGMFNAQVRMIQSQYNIQPGEIDLPAFPLFALFSTAMGMTAIIPDMDPSKPAKVDPAKIIEAITDHSVTTTFGSPAIWKRVAAHAAKNNIKLPTLKRILIAGAPVPWPVIEQLHRMILASADIHTPYGATESLPVSSISGRQVIGETKEQTRGGAGICVGLPVSEIDLRIIRITDDPIQQWSDDLVVHDGDPGEIVVAGPSVTKEYFNLDRATSASRISDGHRLWHRIGDIGYRDDRGRIWFCGRKAHRVETKDETLFSVCCEAIFNEHPDVARSALVGIGPRGTQRPVIIIEPILGSFPRGKRRRQLFTDELLELAAANKRTKSIKSVLFRRILPVDIRHNAKINREKLTQWATTKM
jgi:olefin beta-lactone synthetase